MATALGLKGGWNILDVSTVCSVTGRKWEFRRPVDRHAAKKLVEKDKPRMLMLSPPCTLFSSLQRWSRYGPPEVRRPDDWAEAVAFVIFVLNSVSSRTRRVEDFVLSILVMHQVGR